MSSTLSGEQRSKQERPEIDNLKEWAAGNLDVDVLKRKVAKGAASAQSNAIMKERKNYLRQNRVEEMIILECKGATFSVYAPFATRTSMWMRTTVELYRPQNPPHSIGEYLIVWDDVNPYVADRIADFYVSGSLNIGKKKVVEYATTPPTNPEDKDQTTSLSTLMALILIYSQAIKLQDSALQLAVEGRLRHHLAQRSHLGYLELLEGLLVVYQEGATRDPNALLQRMLLSALVINNTAILLSDIRDLCLEKLRSNPDLFHDYSLGILYYHEFLSNKNPKAESDEHTGLKDAEGKVSGDKKQDETDREK
jgi:hypothetical protein